MYAHAYARARINRTRAPGYNPRARLSLWRGAALADG